MVRLPDVAPARQAKPQPASPYAADAEWPGPAALGHDAILRDLAVRSGWNLADGDLAAHRFASWVRDDDARFDAAAAALQPAEARGFAERSARESFERAKAFKASLPPEAAATFDERLADHQSRVFVKAAQIEDRAQVRALRENLDASLEASVVPAAQAIAALPAGDPDKLDRLDALKAERSALIENNPALTAFEKQQRTAAEMAAIDTAFAEKLSPEEKQSLDPEAAIETVADRIRRLGEERTHASGDTAANPYGFGREVWVNLIREHRPELAEGKTLIDILAMRADRELAADMVEASLSSSARFLAARGHAPTPGPLQLAHVLSPQTVLQLLEGDPDGHASDADPVAAPLRPDLFFVDGDETRPRTVADVLVLADEAMSGTRLVDWRRQLGGVSADLQSALAADGRDAIARAEVEAKHEEAESKRRWFEEAAEGVQAGTFHQADLVKAAETGLVTGEDAERLEEMLKHRSFSEASANAAPEDDAEAALARLIAEFKSEFTVERFNGRSVADVLGTAGIFRHELMRGVIFHVFGREALENFNRFTDELDAGFEDLRDSYRQSLEDSEVSDLGVENRLALFDLAPFFLSMVITAGATGRGQSRRSARKQDDEARWFPGIIVDEPEDWGPFPVVEIKTTPLRTSDAPRGTPEYEALNNPKPNTIYRLDNGTIFRTNSAGKVDRREFTPDPNKRRGRRKVKLDEPAPEGFEVAHGEGVALGGSSDKTNLLFQNINLNRGAYRVFEQQMRKLGVERVNLDYVRRTDPKSNKPDEFHARYLKDGVWRKVEFKNAPGGR